MPSNKSPRKRFKNTLNFLISYFKEVGYRMPRKEKDFWPS
jgi:hypothetical protein